MTGGSCRPCAAGHQSIWIAVNAAGGYAKRLHPESIRSPTKPAAAFPALLFALREISSSKQELAEHVIRHRDVTRQNCRPETKFGPVIFNVWQEDNADI